MKFDRFDLRFQYPDNWKVETDDTADDRTAVTVYHPDGGGYWSVARHASGSDATELAGGVVTAMRAEYDELDAEATAEEIDGRPLTGFDLNFYCLDLTNTAVIRVLQMPMATLLVVYQAEDREFAQLEPVFRAMTVSLLRETYQPEA